MTSKAGVTITYDEFSGTATMAFDGCIIRLPGFFNSHQEAVETGTRLYTLVLRDMLRTPRPQVPRLH